MLLCIYILLLLLFIYDGYIELIFSVSYSSYIASSILPYFLLVLIPLGYFLTGSRVFISEEPDFPSSLNLGPTTSIIWFILLFFCSSSLLYGLILTVYTYLKVEPLWYFYIALSFCFACSLMRLISSKRLESLFKDYLKTSSSIPESSSSYKIGSYFYFFNVYSLSNSRLLPN